jgi:hypothetical protein
MVPNIHQRLGRGSLYRHHSCLRRQSEESAMRNGGLTGCFLRCSKGSRDCLRGRIWDETSDLFVCVAGAFRTSSRDVGPDIWPGPSSGMSRGPSVLGKVSGSRSRRPRRLPFRGVLYRVSHGGMGIHFGNPPENHHYDLHVWLFKPNPAGLFNPANPDVKCPKTGYTLLEHPPKIVAHTH